MKKKILATSAAAAVALGGVTAVPAQAQEGINGDIWTHMAGQSSKAVGEFSAANPMVTQVLLGAAGLGFVALMIAGIVLWAEEQSSK